MSYTVGLIIKAQAWDHYKKKSYKSYSVQKYYLYELVFMYVFMNYILVSEQNSDLLWDLNLQITGLCVRQRNSNRGLGLTVTIVGIYAFFLIPL